jgi:phosphate starvation-inducible protein PhoH
MSRKEKLHQGWHPPQHFKALTSNHLRVLNAIKTSRVVIVNGPPGALKTFLSLQSGLNRMRDGYVERILYIRQNIQRPNEKGLGYRQGDETEKLSPLLKPIEDNLNALVPPGELDYLLRTRKIEGSDIEMIRGRSPLDTFVIADECQNMDFDAIKTIMTRISETSQLVMLGDFKGQRDLHGSDFDAFELVCKHFANVDGFRVINLNHEDILRSPLIIEILRTFDRIDADRKKCR